MLKSLPTLLLLILISISSYAQQAKGIVRGRIVSADNVPAAHVSIGIKDTKWGTSTDEEGRYSLKVPVGTHTLVIHFVGHEPEEKLIEVTDGQTTEVEDFVLRETSKELQEVEVVGGKGFKEDKVSSSLRVATPVLELPQNIQIINKDVLADQQAFDMLDGIQRNVSGAQKVEHWDNYARIFMRGAQVTAFRNGMNVQMPWGPLTEDMSMVDRIEFVKGPAGFMLSTGEPVGLYNVVTKKPTGRQNGEATFSLGSFDTYRTTLDLDGKVLKSGRLLYRINLMGQLKGSHRNFEFNNRYSIVPVLKYVIDDKSSLTLEYTQQFSEMSVIGSNYAFSNRGYAVLPLSFTTAEANLAPSRINDRSILGIFEHKLSQDWKLTAQVSYSQYSMIGQSIWPTRFANGSDSLLQRGISIWDAFAQNRNGQFFVNGKVITGPIVHTLLGGIDLNFKDYYADWNQGASLGDTTFNIYRPKYGNVGTASIPVWDRTRDIRERGVRYNTATNSAYLQDELGFFENRLKLTVAGRFSILKTINPYSGVSDDSRFTPRLGLNVLVTKNTAVYAVYDQSFLPVYGTSWDGKTFKPINATNMEVGVKKDWWGGKWNSTVAFYRITRNNVLTADLAHPRPGGQFFDRQAGQQRAEGVEVDIKGEVVKHLDVVVNYAFTEAKTTKDTYEENVGKPVAGATKHLHNTWLHYRIASGLFQGVTVSLGYQYQSGRSTNFIYDNSSNSLPDYFRLDGGIGYRRDRFGIQLLVNNILDEYLYSGAPYGTLFYWQTEPGINGRITASYRF